MAMTSHAHDGVAGAWIGIDMGTSNCCSSVWDSTRGRPKVMQLRHARPRKGKMGRVMPSALVLGEGDETLLDNVKGTIGYEAVKRMEESMRASRAFVSSAKRLVGLTSVDDGDFPMDVKMEGDEIVIEVQPIGASNKDRVRLTPQQVLSILFRAIRLATAEYLSTQIRKKNLRIPGNDSVVSNCVVGVPAHFGKKQRDLVVEACRQAGFQGHVSTLTESTAASMAYGLFVSVPTTKHILVLDMGGGTTDVTISKLSKEDERFAVIATGGDRKLGGDDMDQAIAQFVLTKLGLDPTQVGPEQRSLLVVKCRKAKESLCGGDNDEPPRESAQIEYEGETIEIQQCVFEQSIEPLLDRLSGLVQETVSRCDASIDEVVLVGGATRVPAVRKLLKELFPSVLDLCTSLDAESAVARGAAIQAAIKSGLVPVSELRSAMMLDALPHPLGVLLPDQQTYVPILEKDASLPAMGCATFALADVHQPGITVVAVEDVGERLERIGEFNFLLRRLSQDQLEKLKG